MQHELKKDVKGGHKGRCPVLTTGEWSMSQRISQGHDPLTQPGCTGGGGKIVSFRGKKKVRLAVKERREGGRIRQANKVEKIKRTWGKIGGPPDCGEKRGARPEGKEERE